eukprot:5788390-Pleurochrysis_carterae.AAC.1
MPCPRSWTAATNSGWPSARQEAAAAACVTDGRAATGRVAAAGRVAAGRLAAERDVNHRTMC